MDSPATIFARRYRVIGELPGHAGVGWRATDLEFGDEVAVFTLPEHFKKDPPSRVAFKGAFDRVRRMAHPGIAAWNGLDFQEGIVVREWLNGFTLLELLRHRRELTALEVIDLLEEFPATLDFLTANQALPEDGLLRETWVVFDPPTAADQLLEHPVSLWPVWRIKCVTLRLEEFAGGGAEDVFATMRPKTVRRSVTQQMAALLRELLGGPSGDNFTKGWTPLPSLNENANGLLKATLEGREWASVQEFWRAFCEMVCDGPLCRLPRNADAVAFATPSAAAPTRCRMLSLRPVSGSGPTIVLCSGPVFRFGRAASGADFLTVVLPQTPENLKITCEISRSHSRIEARERKLWVRDGVGEVASHNGTQWEGAAVVPGAQISVESRGVLNVANRYRVAITPVRGPKSVTVGGAEVELHAATPPGALIMESVREMPALRRAVWIFTALGFHLDAGGQIVWDRDCCVPSVGLFIRAKGGFYLANAGFLPRTLQVGETLPATGEAAPLCDGQILRLGEHSYELSQL